MPALLLCLLTPPVPASPAICHHVFTLISPCLPLHLFPLPHLSPQQSSAQAVFFVCVLHHCRRVVVAVRGTETPEDLLIDGLGRERPLTKADLAGVHP